MIHLIVMEKGKALIAHPVKCSKVTKWTFISMWYENNFKKPGALGPLRLLLNIFQRCVSVVRSFRESKVGEKEEQTRLKVVPAMSASDEDALKWPNHAEKDENKKGICSAFK